MAKKRNNFENDNSGQNKKPSLLNRLFGPVKLLINLHIKLAQKELKKDVKRFFSGILSFLLFLFFLASFYVFLNVLIIFSLDHFFHISFFNAVLILTSFNLLMVVIFFSSATASFKKPFFTETKKALKDTFEELK